MDAYYTQAGWVQVPLADLGIAAGESYVVQDLITEVSYTWRGEFNFVELNPHGLPFHFFKIVKG